MKNSSFYKKISNNIIVVLDELFPLYLIQGKRSFLIDAGITANATKYYDTFQEIPEFTGIDTLLITHSHFDHVGSIPYLQQIYNFNVVASSRTKKILENPKSIKTIEQLNQETKKIIKDPADTHFTQFNKIIVGKEKTILPVSSTQKIEIFETPGHTKCSIAYILYPENILFPGDAAGIIQKNGKILPLFFSSYHQYESSIKKIINLTPDVIALPHNTSIQGQERAANFLKKSLTATQELKENILFHLRKKRDSRMIVEYIFGKESSWPIMLGSREYFYLNMRIMIQVIERELFIATADTEH